MKRKKTYITHNLINLLLLTLAGVLFAAIFPNAIVRYGLGYLSVIAILPVGILIQRIHWYSAPLWGFCYGIFSYGLFNIWLYTFSPVAFVIVPLIYATYFTFMFVALKLADMWGKDYTYLIQAMMWVLYEYLRSTGFLGYSFGILGYSWSFYPFLIQSADIFGIWLFTFFIASVSFFLAQVWRDYGHAYGLRSLAYMLLKPSYRNYLLGVAVFVSFIIVYGLFTFHEDVSEEDSKTVRMSLIQHVTDPWESGFLSYKVSLEKLIFLTDKAMKSETPPDIVVWSETAFVPSIAYNLQYRTAPSHTRLVQDLLQYLQQYPDTEFLIGNGEGVQVEDDRGQNVRKDYNAALFFRGDKRLQSYYKLHLVPFTEYFPYTRLFPRVYEYLKNNDVHFWLQGTEYSVFEGEKIRFSTPICFEDGFGAQNAKFVRSGAEMLINITNDSWSGVESNAMQHLQLSIFRAVENRKHVARGTNAGMTAFINTNGSIEKMLPSYQEGVLTHDVTIYPHARTTLYTRYTDWFVYPIMMVLVILIIGKIVHVLRTRRST